MIKGFEQQTAPLSEYEIQVLIPMMIIGLSRKVGKSNAISAGSIVRQLKENKGIELDGPKIRKLINYIRINNLLPGLLANSKGYYMAQSPKELQDYIISLDQRIEAIRAVRDAISRDLKNIIQ